MTNLFMDAWLLVRVSNLARVCCINKKLVSNGELFFIKNTFLWIGDQTNKKHLESLFHRYLQVFEAQSVENQKIDTNQTSLSSEIQSGPCFGDFL